MGGRKTGNPLVVPDVRLDKHWARFATPAIPDLHLRSIACLPIRCAAEHILGVMQPVASSSLDLLPEY